MKTRRGMQGSATQQTEDTQKPEEGALVQGVAGDGGAAPQRPELGVAGGEVHFSGSLIQFSVVTGCSRAAHIQEGM